MLPCGVYARKDGWNFYTAVFLNIFPSLSTRRRPLSSGTKFCLADIFTKATDSDTFARMRAVIRNSAEDDTGLSVRRMLTTLMRVSPRA